MYFKCAGLFEKWFYCSVYLLTRLLCHVWKSVRNYFNKLSSVLSWKNKKTCPLWEIGTYRVEMLSLMLGFWNFADVCIYTIYGVLKCVECNVLNVCVVTKVSICMCIRLSQDVFSGILLPGVWRNNLKKNS